MVRLLSSYWLSLPLLLVLSSSLNTNTNTNTNTIYVHGFGLLSGWRARRAAKSRATLCQDWLLSRRTVNNFESNNNNNNNNNNGDDANWEPILEDAILAATYAPNHRRTEPWRFHLLGKESIQRVCELNSKLVAAKKGQAAGDKKLKRWLAMPGWLVVTCVRSQDNGDNSNNDNNNMENPTSAAREDYAACCCAVQNLCLSLHARGLGTKWTTGPVNFHPEFASAVGFSGEDEYVVGTIWFGTPASGPIKAPTKRLGVEDVLTRHN